MQSEGDSFSREDAFRLNATVTQYVLVATCEKISTGVVTAVSLRKFLNDMNHCALLL